MSFEKKASAVFLTIMIFFCVLTLYKGAPSAGYYAYIKGATNTMQGVDPYPGDWKSDPRERYGVSDIREVFAWYMYSPVFAIFFYPFTPEILGLYPGVYFWGLLGVLAFWFGFTGVLRHLDPAGAVLKGWWWALALFLLIIELQPNILVSQANILVAGLLMLGLSFYFDGKPALAALLLALSIYTKIVPIVFVLLLMLEFKPKFIGWFVFFMAVMFLVPAIFLPLEFYTGITLHWLDMMATLPTIDNYLGLEPALLYYGLEVNRLGFSVFMMANAAAIALTARRAFLRSHGEFLKFVFPLGILFILLFSRWTERFSFLLATPVFVFMLHAALTERKKGNRALMYMHAAALAISWFLISASYSDICPKACKQFAWDARFKTFGALLMYGWAWAQIFVYSRKKGSGLAL